MSNTDLVALIKREKLRYSSTSTSIKPLNLIESIRNSNLADKIKKHKKTNQREGILVTEIKSAIGSRKANKQTQDLIENIKRSYGGRTSYNIQPVQYTVNSSLIQNIKKDYVDRKHPSLDIGKINDSYQILVTERNINSPFIVDSELVKIIKNYTRNYSSDFDKAKSLFNWFEENIDYGDSKRFGNGYRNSEEVLRYKEGVCGEMAYLYVSMARLLSLTSNYVSVRKDNGGEDVHHACAIVTTENGKILVDPAYHTFDIKHKKFKVLTDQEATRNYVSFRNRLN